MNNQVSRHIKNYSPEYFVCGLLSPEPNALESNVRLQEIDRYATAPLLMIGAKR